LDVQKCDSTDLVQDEDEDENLEHHPQVDVDHAHPHRVAPPRRNLQQTESAVMPL